MSTTTATLPAHVSRAGTGTPQHRASIFWRALWTAVSRLRQPAEPPLDAATRDAVRDAAAVRALADSYRRSDPGFASDLYAAADRHERMFETAPVAAR